MIIVYSSDERKGVESSHLFAQKGYENIFLVSGGFEKFAEEFPGMLEGKHVFKKTSSLKSLKMPKDI